MKPSTAIILGVAGLAVVYFVTRPSTSPLLSLNSSAKPTTTSSVFGSLGSLLGGFVSGANGSKTSVFSGPTSGTSTNVSPVNSGISESEIKNLDASNIADYDAQGTSDSPVYGVAGLDY